MPSMLSVDDDPIIQTGISLPTEILAEVFSLCERHDLATLCISCKRLSAIAERELYKSISIPCLDCGISTHGEGLSPLELVYRSLFKEEDGGVRLGYVQHLVLKSLRLVSSLSNLESRSARY